MNPRLKEQRIYQELYGQIGSDEINVYQETDTNYGRGTHGNGVVQFTLKFFKPESLLDVGCGRDNEFCKLCRDKYRIFIGEKELPRLVGVDFAAKPHKLKNIEFYNARAEEIPFKDEEFDVVTTFDMLEHILPEDIDIVLDELFRVAKKGVVCTIAHNQVSRGLHNIIEPEEWWEEKLKKYGKIIRYLKYWIIKK